MDKIYERWHRMLDRCYNNKSRDYPNYGGRGITVCIEWKYSFEAFYNSMGDDPPTEKHSIDRINNDGNYEPSNCRWATHTEQMKNRRKFKMSAEIIKAREEMGWYRGVNNYYVRKSKCITKN